MENNLYQQKMQTFEVSTSGFITRVYQWMTIGILLTALVAMILANNSLLLRSMIMGPMRFVLIIAQLGLVIGLSSMIERIKARTAILIFLAYSLLTGVTLSVLAYIYTAASIQSAFFTTSISFFALAMYGHITKKDLSGMATFLMMALFGVFILSLLSFIIPSMNTGPVGIFMNLATLLIFAGFTAYDSQRIKAMAQMAYDDEMRSKMAIIGALSMYLNFINMFISILRLTGNRRD